MKSFHKLFLVTLIGLFLGVGQAHAATLATYTFNDPGDLTAYFTQGSGSAYTNAASGGIDDSGSISVDTLTGIYGSNAAYAMPAIGGGLTLSAYFLNDGTAGYGGMGIMDGAYAAIGNPATPGTLAEMGAYFHGGGGSFTNDNNEASNVSWVGGDLVNGNWYKIVLSIKRTATNTYNLTLQVWNSDATGALLSKKTEHTVTGITNSSLSGSVHPFFGTDGLNRFVTMDNFVVTDEPLDTTPVDTTAPELVIMQPIPSRVKISDAVLVFRTDDSTCDINANPVSSSVGGTVALHIDPLPLVYDSDTQAYLTGMQVGGTYSFSFNCIDEALNESNTLTAGPFKIIPNQQTSVGGHMSTESLAKAGITIEPQNTPATCSSSDLLTFPVNIKTLQKRLLALGFNPGPIDGISGPMTISAIKQAQAKLGTVADGLVGPITINLLNKSCK